MEGRNRIGRCEWIMDDDGVCMYMYVCMYM